VQRELAVAPGLLAWVLNAYALPFGGCLLVGGRLGDLLGARRVFLAGLLTLAGASCVAGLAPGVGILIAARAVQGLAAAALSPAALTLLAQLFPGGPRRAWALGLSGAIAALGYTIGTALGGVLTDLLSWRWALLAGAPVALAAALASPMVVPALPAAQRGRHLDVPGALAVTLGLAALLAALTAAAETDWRPPLVGLALTGVLVLLAFSSTVVAADGSKAPTGACHGCVQIRRLPGGPGHQHLVDAVPDAVGADEVRPHHHGAADHQELAERIDGQTGSL